MRLPKKLLLIGLALGLTVHMAIAAEEDPVYGRVGNFIIKKSDFERLMGYYNSIAGKYRSPSTVESVKMMID